jgi:hypothetical protein
LKEAGAKCKRNGQFSHGFDVATENFKNANVESQY